MNNYKGPGASRTITAGAAYSSGDVVVVGQQLAIAAVDIASGATGTVELEGEFHTIDKASAAVIADGEMVMWDSSESEFDDNAATPASGDVTNAAVAVGAWGNGTTTMIIQLANRIGTVA